MNKISVVRIRDVCMFRQFFCNTLYIGILECYRRTFEDLLMRVYSLVQKPRYYWLSAFLVLNLQKISNALDHNLMSTSLNKVLTAMPSICYEARACFSLNEFDRKVQMKNLPVDTAYIAFYSVIFKTFSTTPLLPNVVSTSLSPIFNNIPQRNFRFTRVYWCST